MAPFGRKASSARVFLNVFDSLQSKIAPFNISHAQKVNFTSSRDPNVLLSVVSTIPADRKLPVEKMEIVRKTPKARIISDSLLNKFTDQSHLQMEIKSMFLDKKSFDVSLFDIFVVSKLQDCNASDLSLFMRLSGQQSRRQSNDFLMRQLPTIATHIKTLLPSKWCYADISFVVYGLQSFVEKDAGYLDILSMMSTVATTNQDSGEACTSKNIGMILYGLQKNAAQEPVSQNFLLLIEQMIVRSVDSFSAQTVGNSLYGLKEMCSDISEVRILLSALAVKVQDSNADLNGQELANALYGLRRMKSDSVEVCALLSALVPKVQGCEEVLNALAVGLALYGLQGMSSESKDVCALLSALIPKVHSCKVSPTSQNISNALFGLQGMSSDNATVRDLLTALEPKVRSCQAAFRPQEVSNALFGLQRMSSDYLEVRALLSALAPRVLSCESIMHGRELKSALYGMRGLNGSSTEVCALVSAIVPKIHSCKSDFDAQALSDMLIGTHQLFHLPEFQSVTGMLFNEVHKLRRKSIKYSSLRYKEIVFLGQSITISQPALKDCVGKDDYIKWEETREALYSALVIRMGKKPLHISDSKRIAGKRVYGLLERVFEKSAIKMFQDERLFGFFMTTIVLNVQYSKNDHLIINIELDEISAKMPERVVRSRIMRDKYFRSQGVFCYRIDHTVIETLTGEEIQEWVLDKVASAVAARSKEDSEKKMAMNE